MLRCSLLFFPGVAASPWWEVSLEVSPSLSPRMHITETNLYSVSAIWRPHSAALDLAQGGQGRTAHYFFLQSLLAFWGPILDIISTVSAIYAHRNDSDVLTTDTPQLLRCSRKSASFQRGGLLFPWLINGARTVTGRPVFIEQKL